MHLSIYLQLTAKDKDHAIPDYKSRRKSWTLANIDHYSLLTYYIKASINNINI